MTDADRVLEAVERLNRRIMTAFAVVVTALGFIWWMVDQQANKQRVTDTQILNIKAREQGIYQRIEQLEREHDDERPDQAKSDRSDP